MKRERKHAFGDVLAHCGWRLCADYLNDGAFRAIVINPLGIRLIHIDAAM
jgi:hypothetical protein